MFTTQKHGVCLFRTKVEDIVYFVLIKQAHKSIFFYFKICSVNLLKIVVDSENFRIFAKVRYDIQNINPKIYTWQQ